MQKQNKQSNVEPNVGIFWLQNGKLIIDSTPVSKAEPYGDSLGHATAHIDYWTELQERGAVPPEVEYEEPPRGRVVYAKRENKFHLLADQCILSRKDIVARIMEALNLPPDMTSTGRDSHYRCAKCLSLTEQRDEL